MKQWEIFSTTPFSACSEQSPCLILLNLYLTIKIHCLSPMRNLSWLRSTKCHPLEITANTLADPNPCSYSDAIFCILDEVQNYFFLSMCHVLTLIFFQSASFYGTDLFTCYASFDLIPLQTMIYNCFIIKKKRAEKRNRDIGWWALTLNWANIWCTFQKNL